MQLILDIGNTRVKLAIYDGPVLCVRAVSSEFTRAWLEVQLTDWAVDKGILSATGEIPEWLPAYLTTKMPWFELSHQTPLPFTITYQTPETLGRDRIAGIAGALALGYHPPLLVIDAGTCVTIDLLDDQFCFTGGSISPGIAMRLEAMHTFTHRLPLIAMDSDINLPGTDTRSALAAGAQMGTVCEIEGQIMRYKEIFPKLNVVLTGGDQEFLVSRLKSIIFAHADLVLAGLNHILNHQTDAG